MHRRGTHCARRATPRQSYPSRGGVGELGTPAGDLGDQAAPPRKPGTSGGRDGGPPRGCARRRRPSSSGERGRSRRRPGSHGRTTRRTRTRDPPRARSPSAAQKTCETSACRARGALVARAPLDMKAWDSAPGLLLLSAWLRRWRPTTRSAGRRTNSWLPRARWRGGSPDHRRGGGNGSHAGRWPHATGPGASAAAAWKPSWNVSKGDDTYPSYRSAARREGRRCAGVRALRKADVCARAGRRWRDPRTVDSRATRTAWSGVVSGVGDMSRGVTWGLEPSDFGVKGSVDRDSGQGQRRLQGDTGT